MAETAKVLDTRSDASVGTWNMRRLTRDEIADSLVTIRPRSAAERQAKERAQQYVKARDSARREDAGLGPEVAAVRQTYETAKAFAELLRDALATALPALGNQPVLAADIARLVSDWRDPASAAAKNAVAEIKS